MATLTARTTAFLYTVRGPDLATLLRDHKHVYRFMYRIGACATRRAPDHRLALTLSSRARARTFP